MAETIESFVEKLQTEGIDAGRKEAEKILAEAHQQAEEIIRQAKAKAEKIIADATSQAESTLARSQIELQLAARDTGLKLREVLGRAIGAVLARGAEASLKDPDFLGQILHDIVTQYAKAVFGKANTVTINVAPEMRKKLSEWALHEMVDAKETGKSGEVSLNLKTSLHAAGFEYKIDGATVEVTVESVAESLKSLVGPELREIIDGAMAEGGS